MRGPITQSWQIVENDEPLAEQASWWQLEQAAVDTGAWSGIDTLAKRNKVEHDEIQMCIGKLTQER